MVQNASMKVLERNGPEIAGGMVGVGAPIALREFADVQTGPLVTGQGDLVARMTRPSVVYGVGGGALTGILWLLDVGPNMLQDFYAAHAITGIATGIGSAAIPKMSGGGGGDGGTQTIRRSTTPAVADGGDDEFAPADGPSEEFEDAS